MKTALRTLAGGLTIMLLALAGRTLLNTPVSEVGPLPSPEPTETAAASVTATSVDLSEITAILTNLTNLVAVVIEQQSKAPLAYSASDESAVDRSFVHKQADRIYETIGETNDDLLVRIEALEESTVDSSAIAALVTTELLGVGTTTPSETLTIDGNILSTGHMALGNRAVGADRINAFNGTSTWYWGDTQPRASLIINEEVTEVVPGQWGGFQQGSGIINYLTVNPQSDASNATYIASENVAYVPSDNTQSILQVFGGTFDAYNYGVASDVANDLYLNAMSVTAYNAGVSDSVTGLSSYASTRNGTSTSAYGAYINASLEGTGAITSAYGIQAQVRNYGSGTITNAYGIHISTVQGTNNWGLYQSNTGNRNYFAGAVNIGTTATNTPSKLTVVSSNVASTTLRLESPRVAIVTNNILGGIDFASNDTNLTTPGTTTASILALANTTHTASALGTDLSFFTTNGTTTAERLRILGGGNIGVGTSTPSAQLTTTGTVRFAGLGAGSLQTDALGNVTVSSDEQLKDVKEQFTRGVADLVKINPITYTWKPETGYDTATVYTGFSAQNVHDAIPEAVATDMKGYLTLSDRPILAAVVNAVKELWAKVMGHDAEIEALKEQLRLQQAEIQVLQDALDIETSIVESDDSTNDVEEENTGSDVADDGSLLEEEIVPPEGETPEEQEDVSDDVLQSGTEESTESPTEAVSDSVIEASS